MQYGIIKHKFCCWKNNFIERIFGHHLPPHWKEKDKLWTSSAASSAIKNRLIISIRIFDHTLVLCIVENKFLIWIWYHDFGDWWFLKRNMVIPKKKKKYIVWLSFFTSLPKIYLFPLVFSSVLNSRSRNYMWCNFEWI